MYRERDVHFHIYIYIYILHTYTYIDIYICICIYQVGGGGEVAVARLWILSRDTRRSLVSERGEVLLRGVGTLRECLILGENSACRVPICAVAA